MYRQSFAEINLDQFKKNFLWIKNSFSKNPFICPMVKANAYGHGDVVIAQTLENLGVDHLGVCLIEEGIRLRKNQVESEILVFRGFEEDGAFALHEHSLTPVVSTYSQIEALVKVSRYFKQKKSFHLKFDTGMNRLGFSIDEGRAVLEKIASHPELDMKAILTHLHSGENSDDPKGSSVEQLQNLLSLKAYLPPSSEVFFHALNSAGMAHALTLQNNPSHCLGKENWGLRPGLAIYGYCESLGERQFQYLTPVMSLKSHVAVIRELKIGETVSYGASWKAARNSYIAVIPVGYADGYHRRLSNRAEAMLLGHRVPVVGRVCMDYLMVDLTDLMKALSLTKDSPKIFEEEVVLFGPKSKPDDISAAEIAQKSETISWEVLTSVSERIPRVYTGQMSRFVKNEVFQ